MPLTAGARIGPYEVVGSLGAGGMGEVYRARDTRLKRDVAIKILPDAFATDTERIARFRREAELLATLNHPNIATVHGLEESADLVAIAMELVDGQSLADKFDESKAALPLGEALAIARQICDGLEAAHDKGIVHRDLKPANIMLTHDGQVKILDFGLAKLDAVAPSGVSQLTHSPTVTFAATQAGLILGTAAYMSPEQAKGRAADKRSDVWAFGCVLYEMLTGKRAFDGEDVSDVLATVLKSEPDWAVFPSDVPEHVRNIVKRSMAKDRKSRIPDMSVVRFLLDDASSAAPAPVATVSAPVKSSIAWKLVTAVLLLTTAGASAAWYFTRSVPSPVARFQVPPPEKGSFIVTTAGVRFVAPHAAISPDGNTLAFAARDATGKISLWVRPVNSIAMQPLPGSDGASYPFWSPDGRFIGYFAGGKLMKIAAAGGPPQTLCSAAGRGGTWNRDGVIVFNGGPGPLLRVSSGGGEPTPIMKDTASFPSFLPDGRHVLNYRLAGFVAVESTDDGSSRRLVDADSGAVYSRSGHLLFVRQGTLMAQSFDPRTLSLAGDPFPVAENVQMGTPPGHIAFSVSDTGVLAFGSANAAVGGRFQLTWLNRQGHVTGTFGAVEDIRGIDLSPDDTRLAHHVHVVGQGGDIWLSDLSRGITSRFTFDASQDNSSPLWSIDGTSLTFASKRGGKSGIYRKAADGSSTEELLVEEGNDIAPSGWSADGKTLVYTPLNSGTGADIFLLPLAANAKPIPLLTARGTETHGQPSPNGRWLAYDSAESGTLETYVRAFPTGSGKWQISSGGGRWPRWRRDGRELYFMSSQSMGRLMAVDVNTAGTTFETVTPKALFDSGWVNQPHTSSYHAYAVTRDGQRFLIPRPQSKLVDENEALPVTVVTNWFQEVKNRQ